MNNGSNSDISDSIYTFLGAMQAYFQPICAIWRFEKPPWPPTLYH